jgi:succinoglycan biosynthesis protein ExoV
VADALRVPWVAVQTTPWLLPFKWLDWCMSIGVDYQAAPMTGLEGLPAHQQIRNIRGVRGSRTAIRESWRYWIYQAQARLQLQRIAQRSRPTLSNATHLEQLTQQMEESLEQLKADVAAGRFALADHPQHSPNV